jgi:hypothetical protein
MQILEKGKKSKTAGWVFALLGWIMTGHFVFLFSRCFLRGTPEDIFWISHVGTLIGGLGALFRNRFLISMALVCLLGHHLTWLFDTTFWLVTGKFPIGTTTYLKDASLEDWLQSSNHFFTVPSLFLLACWQGGIRKDAWIWSTILFSILLLISYFYLPPTANVNSAHKLWPGLDQSYLSVLEQLPNLGYLFSLIILNSIGNYLPANLLLRVVYYFLKTIGCERPTTSKSRP